MNRIKNKNNMNMNIIKNTVSMIVNIELVKLMNALKFYFTLSCLNRDRKSNEKHGSYCSP